MDYKILLTLIQLATFGCHSAGRLIMKPRDTEIKINHSTYFNCSTEHGATSAFWFHETKHVFAGNAILEPYHERFQVNHLVWNGTYVYNLIIHSVQHVDAGKYTCTEDEGVGEQYSAQLIVLEDDPLCRSNTELDEVIGQNTCNIEPDKVELECSVTYHGNIPPRMEWKKFGEDSSASLEISVASSRNYFVSRLKLNGDITLNNSCYVCEAHRSTGEPIKCTSKVIHVLYAVSGNTTVNTTINDEIRCKANTSQSCSYKWKWLQDNSVTTESSTSVLITTKPGWHRCEAECYLRNKSCNFLVMRAMVYGETKSSQTRHIIIAVAVTVVVTVLVTFGGLCAAVWIFANRDERAEAAAENKDSNNDELCLQGLMQNDRPPDKLATESIPDGLPEKYRSDTVLIETIQTKVAGEIKQSIEGFTVLDDELFVVSNRSSEVQVYDMVKLIYKHRLIIDELIYPQDIVSCNTNKCLYIFDSKESDRLSAILKFYPNEKKMRWSRDCDYGLCLCVTNELNIILTVYNESRLDEYSPDGECIRTIILSPEAGFRFPVHAIKLTNGHFVVSYGFRDSDLYGLCIMDADGKLVKSFGTKCGSNNEQLNRPVHLCVDGNGFVLVADQYNDRVLLLDSNLRFQREILSKVKHGLLCPKRILLDEPRSRIIVAEDHLGSVGMIRVYRMSSNETE